jgi:hypothetical protein
MPPAKTVQAQQSRRTKRTSRQVVLQQVVELDGARDENHCHHATQVKKSKKQLKTQQMVTIIEEF